jgi:hypothetical protein
MPAQALQSKLDLSLKASRKHRSGIECRREQRLPVGDGAKIILFESRSSVSVKLRDLSTRGIGILLVAPLKRDERFLLLLPASMVIKKRAIVCTVVFCRPGPNGEYEIGATFTNVLTNGLLPPDTPIEEIQALPADVQSKVELPNDEAAGSNSQSAQH